MGLLKLFPKIFYIALLFYILNQFLLKQFFTLNLLHYYMNDFLFPIIFIPAIFFLRQQLKLTNRKRPGFWFIIGFCIIFSIFFELIIPKLQNLSIGDPDDVFAYFLGGITLHFAYNEVK